MNRHFVAVSEVQFDGSFELPSGCFEFLESHEGLPFDNTF